MEPWLHQAGQSDWQSDWQSAGQNSGQRCLEWTVYVGSWYRWYKIELFPRRSIQVKAVPSAFSMRFTDIGLNMPDLGSWKWKDAQVDERTWIQEAKNMNAKWRTYMVNEQKQCEWMEKNASTVGRERCACSKSAGTISQKVCLARAPLGERIR